MYLDLNYSRTTEMHEKTRKYVLSWELLLRKRDTHKPIGNCGQIIALGIEVLQAARIVAKVSFALRHRLAGATIDQDSVQRIKTSIDAI